MFQLIDLALIVKRDAVGLSGDPLSKHMPSFCSSYYEAFQDSAITNTVSGSNTATQMTGKGPGLVSPNQVSAPPPIANLLNAYSLFLMILYAFHTQR